MIIVDERERKRKNATNTMEHASTGEQGESFPCLLPSSPPSPTSAQFLFGPRFVPFPTNQLVTFFSITLFHLALPSPSLAPRTLFMSTPPHCVSAQKRHLLFLLCPPFFHFFSFYSVLFLPRVCIDVFGTPFFCYRIASFSIFRRTFPRYPLLMIPSFDSRSTARTSGKDPLFLHSINLLGRSGFSQS